MTEDRPEVTETETETETGTETETETETETDDRVARARRELELAADGASSHVMEQLRSVEEGLDEVVGGDELVEGHKTRDSHPHVDRLDELREKLAGLETETDEDGEVDRHVEAAATHLAEYRQDITEE